MDPALTDPAAAVETLFMAALEKPTPRERRAFLETACAGNAALRERVCELLEAHEEAQGPLDALPCGAGVTAGLGEPGEGPGTRIGPYQLLEQIGEGAFGVVYLAEQLEPIQRKVALKVLKPGMDSKQVIARFEAERQALALMDHPNIAKVLDAGTIEPIADRRLQNADLKSALSNLHSAIGAGRPYFVMELVRGVPITQFCDDNRLPPRERLELFTAVCQAVQHAHSKGVIHRDLKPSNVLVTLHDGPPHPTLSRRRGEGNQETLSPGGGGEGGVRGVVKVIDFGIAKALGEPLSDKTLFTGFAQMVGTPAYMSPEQAEMSALDVDTRSDVYSLGVLLYELLTGTTPFDKERLCAVGFDEMRRILREEEPPRPSTRLSTLGPAATLVSAQRQSDPRRLGTLFRGELDWIVMKALEKDRSRRYQTANSLARDIDRYLADEPVEACPPSAAYRLRKFARKHRRLLGTAAAFLGLLVLAVIGLVIGLVAMNREQQNTQAALAAERTAKEHARAALDALTDDVVETMFARQPQLGETEKAFLRKVLASYEAVTQDLGETGETRLLRARGFFKVARLHALLGEQLQAEAGYRQALQVLERLTTEFPGVPEYRQKLAASYDALAIALAELDKPAEAEMAFRRAAALGKKLVDDFPDVPEYRWRLSVSYQDLGKLLRQERKFKDAEDATDAPWS
jgi:serine/threonine protein kinase